MSSMKHTVIPRQLQTKNSYNGNIVPYQLSEQELAWAREGRTDLIPTAAQRGLSAPPVTPRPEIVKQEPEKDRTRNPSLKEITGEMLKNDLAAGLKNVEMAKKYGMPISTVSYLLQKHGLSGKKGLRKRKVVKT